VQANAKHTRFFEPNLKIEDPDPNVLSSLDPQPNFENNLQVQNANMSGYRDRVNISGDNVELKM